jgi:hypothetical protein
MRGLFAGFGAISCSLFTLILGVPSAHGQTGNAPPPHVIIPNPTPRPPDLLQEFGDNPADQKKNDVMSIQNQLRAREIWLESNQILLLAQQLQQQLVADKKSLATPSNTAKVAKIEKLAQSVQEKMKVH